MELKWKFFLKGHDVTEYINKYRIKRENILSILVGDSGGYELFYWEEC